MKVPLSWLADYVSLPLPVAQLMERITLAGLEVSGVRVLGLRVPEGLRVKGEDAGPMWAPDKVMLATVIKTDKHPNADKLKLVTVDYGAGRTKEVVTGATNVNVGDSGQRVILGLSGTQYFDGHVTPKALAELKPTKIRGVPSDAMLMSEFELGISDEHAGIILLGDDAPAPGTPLADYMGDIVLEIDVLPNMARCLSMIGIAREVAAITGQRLRLPPLRRRLELEEIGDVTAVQLVDPKILDEQNVQVIGEQLFSLVDDVGRRKLLLDLRNVEYLSSAALGKLITLHKKLQAVGGKLMLCNIDPQIYEVFEITKLDKFFEITKSQQPGKPSKAAVRVAIDDPKLSARYAAMLIRGVKIGPSPAWMQRRLTYAGMRPISNIVDITNYVMLEWGQPLHAFDYDKLVQRAGGKTPIITVRPARKGEILTTLDNVKRELTPDNLVIADAAGPVAIAGVMGGADTEVSASTTNILLEAANFDFVSIRRTMKALNLPSEASVRFSKGIHPETVRPAAERAAELMRQHAGGIVAGGLVDTYPAPAPPQVIELPKREVRRSLGMDFPIEEAARILRSLEFLVEPAGLKTLRVTTPPHRLDIQAGPADLIEELVRIHGYDRLPATLLADQLPEQHGNRALALEERVRDILVGAGLQEVITYSLTTPEREAPLCPSTIEYVRLVNPISSERVVMRHTILAGVLEVAAANLRHTDDVRFFEIGAVYLPQPGEKLPAEPRWLAIVLAGRRNIEFWQNATAQLPEPLDFFDLKGVMESFVADLPLPKLSYESVDDVALHPGRAATLVVDGKAVGNFGQLHPKVAEAFGLGNRQVLVGEFDLEAILARVPERYTYTPVPRFPPALRDVAVIVEETLPGESVAGEIRAAGGDLLRNIRLFDLYRGDSIPPGTKSLAYALTYQADDRTLTDKEVDKAHKRIEDRLKHVLKARIRGQDA
jgi:phenylalanyl-tRNA synthetase beta chain